MRILGVIQIKQIKITCRAFEEAIKELVIISSCHDMGGEWAGGYPRIDLSYGKLSDPDKPLVKSVRHPRPMDAEYPGDRLPCEHYLVEYDGNDNSGI